MATLDEGLRERLGLAEDADEATILAAIDDLVDTATAPETGQPAEPVAASLPSGVVAIDEQTLAELRAAAEDGRAARAQQRTETRDRAIGDAIAAGKIPPARRAHFEQLWAADPDGATQTLADLAPGLVPIEDNGVPGGDENLDNEAELDRLHSVKGR